MQVKQLAQVIEENVRAGMTLHDAVHGLERFLASRGADQLMPSILQVLFRKFQAQKGVNVCQITTAHDTGSAILREIAATLGGGEYTHKVDAELLGGFTALHQHRLVDASTKRHVDALERVLS